MYLIFKKNWKKPISPEVRINIKNKNKLWEKYLRTKDRTVLEEYKQTSDRVRQQTRKIDQDEQLSMAKECKVNPNKFWNYIKSKSYSHDTIGDLILKEENEEG